MKFFYSDHHFNNFYINIYSSRPWLHHVKGNKILFENKVVETFEQTTDDPSLDTSTLDKNSLINIWQTNLKNKNPIFIKARNLTVTKMNQDLIHLWNSDIKEDDEVIYGGDFAFPASEAQMIRLLSKLNGIKHIIEGNHDPSTQKLLRAGFTSAQKQMTIKISEDEVLLCHYPFINPIFTKLAQEHRVIPQYKKSKPCQGEVLKELLNKVDSKDHKSIKEFLERALKLNLHLDKEDVKKSYHKLKRYLSMVIGTRPINNGQILLHGHTHNDTKRVGNMINICVEAWNYLPPSEKDILKQIDEYKKELAFLRTASFDNLKTKEAALKFYAKAYEHNKECEIFKEFYFIHLAYQAISNKNESFNIPKNYTKRWYELMVENQMFIDKKNLLDQSFYKGKCRNASLALWSAMDGKFYYLREKFGSTFIEPINHVLDDDGYDLFIPLESCEFNQEVYERFLEYQTKKGG